MANFLGAAFGFGARDVGLESAMNSATKNLDKVNGLLEDQSDIAKKSKVSGLMERIKQFNVASIAGSVRQLTGETGNLSNGLESMAVSYAQSAKPIIASMDLTGKEARKMTSRVVGMAIGLNTSADAVAETFKAIHDAGGPAKSAIDAMGYSEKDWVKITQTTGVTMQDFAGMMGDMVASWSASPKQAAQMADNIMAIGKAAKIGTSAIKGAKQHLDALDVIFEQLPPSMARTADEVQSLMESTYKLAGAFREMGETEEQATQLGQDTAKMFAEQATLINKLYAMGGDQNLSDSPLFEFLTRLGIGTDEAKAIIDEGSRDVVQGVTRINEVFQRMGGDSSPQVQHALAGLNQAMGQSAAGLGWLASNLDTGTKSLAAMANMTVKGEGALKKYGNQAYSSGRTLQESFDLAKESFETQVRGIARKDVGRLVQKQIQGYRRVGKEVKALGADETWGPLMKAVSTFDQMGVRGLGLAFLDKNASKEAVDSAIDMGIKYEYAFDKVKQFGEGLSPIMEMLGMFGPLGPLMAAGGIAALFVMDDKDAKSILGGFYDTFNGIKKMIVNVLDQVPWGSIWDKITGAASKLWTSAMNKIPWQDMVDKVMPVLRKIGSELLDALAGAVKGLLDELSVGELALGGAIVTGLTMGNAFGPAGALVGLISGALVAGTLSAISKLEAMEEKNKQAARDLNKAKAQGARVGVQTRNEKEGEKAAWMGRRGEKVTAERMLRGYESGKLEKDYGGQVDWGERLRTDFKLGDVSQELRKQIGVSMGVAAKDVGSGEVARLYRRMEELQQLPEVQARLADAEKGGMASLAAEIRGLSAEYASVTNDTFQSMLDQAAAVDLAIGELEELGISTMGEEQFETRIAVSTAGETESLTASRGVTEFDAMAAKGQYELDRINAKMVETEARLVEDMASMASSAYAGGDTIVAEFGLGFSDGGVTMMGNVEGAVQNAAALLGGSLPEAGPLAGTEGNNPAYFGGRSVMEQFAYGIEASTDMVRESMAKTLDDSVILTMEEYGKKVEELSKKKSLLADVAKAMVRDFGGSLDLGSIKVEGEGDLSAKQTFEAALNLPGLAGVIAAVASDGHKTRVLLKKIWDDTHAIAGSDLVKNSKTGGTGRLAVLPG